MTDLLGAMIGAGGCAEVYEWGMDRVVKVFKENTDEYAVQREYELSKAAWEIGVPARRTWERLEVNGRPAILFDKVVGQTMMDRFFGNVMAMAQRDSSGLLSEMLRELRDDSDNDVRLSARAFFQVHQKTLAGIPDLIDTTKHMIGRVTHLEEREKQQIYAYMDHLPRQTKLCHGDPNPGNLFICEGRPVLIDWMNATSGNPASDIASYVLLMRYSVLPEQAPGFVKEVFGAVREPILETFLEEYCGLSGMTLEEIEAWILPVAAAKLHADAISEEEKAVLAGLVRERLQGLQRH